MVRWAFLVGVVLASQLTLAMNPVEEQQTLGQRRPVVRKRSASQGGRTLAAAQRQLGESIRNHDFLVLLVTRDRRPIALTASSNSYYASWSYSHVEESGLGEDARENIMGNINTIISKNSSERRTIFVVFDEYFFEKGDISEPQYVQEVLNEIRQMSRKWPWGVFYVNFLRKVDLLSPEEIKKQRVLSQTIGGNAIKMEWDVTDNESKGRVCSEFKASELARRQFFSNESVAIVGGENKIAHRKLTYYREGNFNLDKMIYVRGDGEDKKLDSDGYADVLWKNVRMETCWDIQKHIRKKISILKRRKYSELNCGQQLQELEQNLPRTTFEGAKIIVIQSNYTNLSEVVSDFPDGAVVIHSDPVAPAVFKIQYPEDLRRRLDVIEQCLPKSLPQEGTRQRVLMEECQDQQKEEVVKNNLCRVVHPATIIASQAFEVNDSKGNKQTISMVLYDCARLKEQGD